MYKCVIFDMDGTLLNTLDDLADSGNYTLQKFGLPVHDVEKYRYFVGNGIPKLVERFMPEGTSEEKLKEAFDIMCSNYNKHMNDKTRPYDNVVEMLKILKSENTMVFVVTNKADAFAKEIVKYYFGDLIYEVYGNVEGFPKKPDPYWVDKIISAYNLDKSDVLFVGDSGVDMQTACNAKIASAGVLWGFRDKDELIKNGADYICGNCSDILNLVLKN